MSNTNNQSASARNIPYTNAVVRLTGTDGNAFSIIGKVSRAISKSNHPELLEQFMDEATSGNYDNLLETCMRYVNVE